MIKKRLIFRTADEHDKRKYHLSLTEQASDIISEIEQSERGLSEDYISGTVRRRNRTVYENESKNIGKCVERTGGKG